MNVPAKPSLISTLALKHSMDPDAFYKTIQKTIMPPNATVEQTAALLMVAHQYDLNPILKQIYAFPSKGGGITPIISVDGWCELINRQPTFDGMEFEDHFSAEGDVYAITCRMFRKDRSRPTVVTEYLDECYRATDPWKTSPKRMLRHRAMIQCARLTFGLSAAFDEGHQIEATPVEVDMEPMQRQVAPPKSRAPSPKDRVDAKRREEDPDLYGKPEKGDKVEQSSSRDEKHDPETGEVFDPEMFLTDLDTSLSTAKTKQELSAIWSDFDTQTTLVAHKDHFLRAKDLMVWHEKRLAEAK